MTRQRHAPRPQPDTVATRGAPVLATIVVLLFLGLTALPSGVVMLVGGTDVFPAEWVDAFPVIDSLVLPGLVLLLGFGVGSLLTAYAVLRRPAWPVLDLVERWTDHHWSWLATLLLGAGQVVWIALELAYLDTVSFLQPFYGAIGLLLLLLPATRSVRGWLRPSPVRG